MGANSFIQEKSIDHSPPPNKNEEHQNLDKNGTQKDKKLELPSPHGQKNSVIEYNHAVPKESNDKMVKKEP